jgi:hypothetical protein
MPYPIQTARFAALVRRLFGIQGHVGLQAIDDVFLTMPVTRDRIELDAMRGDFPLGAWRDSIAGGAGNLSNVQLVNPSDSGRLVVVDHLHYSPAVAVVNVGILRSTAVPARNGLTRDTRDYFFDIATGGLFQGRAVITTAQVAIPGVLPSTAAFDRLDGHDIDGDVCVLTPGHALVVEQTLANANVLAAFKWREHVLTSGEERLG